MNSDLVFYIAVALAFVGVTGITFHAWKNVPRKIITIPLAILLMLAAVLSLNLASSVSLTEVERASNNQQYLESSWVQLENELQNAMNDNFDLSQKLARDVVEKLDNVPLKKLDEQLDAVGLAHENLIQDAVGSTLKGVYYKGFESDAMVPFAMIIGKGQDDSFIFADFSENCAVDQITRKLSQEYELQGRNGNKALAVAAFSRLVNLEDGKPLPETIFFQFSAKQGAELKSYNLRGLQQTFMENKGDIELTFKSIEFLAPTYIYSDRSIGGTTCALDRAKPGAKTIAIVSVFSFYELMAQRPEMVNDVLNLKDLNQFAQVESIRHERASLTIGILVMLITLILYIYFWTYTRYNALHSRSTDAIPDAVRG